jgi:hypothetical protein
MGRLALTFMFYQYARVRTWMERAPRRERWPWYWWLSVWCVLLVQMT